MANAMLQVHPLKHALCYLSPTRFAIDTWSKSGEVPPTKGALDAQKQLTAKWWV